MNEEITNYKEEHVVSSDIKFKNFGYGEWVEEPDEVAFEYKGIKCKIHRVYKREPYNLKYIFGGHLCGYIQVPSDHPWFNAKYNEIDAVVHGGLTYGARHDNIIEDFWLGFDCGHAWDIIPSMQAFSKEIKRKTLENIEMLDVPPAVSISGVLFKDVYRNIEFVKNECCNLVDQMLVVKR